MIVDVNPPYIVEERRDPYQNISRITDSEPKIEPPLWPKLFWVISFLCEDTPDGESSAPYVIPIPDDELHQIYWSSYWFHEPILKDSHFSPTPTPTPTLTTSPTTSPTPIITTSPTPITSPTLTTATATNTNIFTEDEIILNDMCFTPTPNNFYDNELLLNNLYFSPTLNKELVEIKNLNPSEELCGFNSKAPALIEIKIRSEIDYFELPKTQSIGELPDSVESHGDAEEADFVQIASVLITYVFLPSFINLLNAYLFEKLHKNRQKSFIVKLDFSVNNGTKIKKVKFEGPITALKEAMDIVKKTIF